MNFYTIVESIPKVSIVLVDAHMYLWYKKNTISSKWFHKIRNFDDFGCPTVGKHIDLSYMIETSRLDTESVNFFIVVESIPKVSIVLVDAHKYLWYKKNTTLSKWFEKRRNFYEFGWLTAHRKTRYSYSEPFGVQPAPGFLEIERISIEDFSELKRS